MKRQFLLLPMAFLCLSGCMNTVTAVKSVKTEEDTGRIQYVEYNTNTVVRIRAKAGYTITVQLDKGEYAEQSTIVMGNSGLNWNMVAKGNNLIFNPTLKSVRTNLTVITNKQRTYVFDLALADCSYNNQGKKVCPQPIYLVRFNYPDDRVADDTATTEKELNDDDEE